VAAAIAGVISMMLAGGAHSANTTGRTGKGAVRDESVYCQNWPGHSSRPQYQGTGPQTPFGADCTRPPPQQPPQQPRRQPQPSADDNARVCTLRQLAAMIDERYGTGYPIATVRVANQPNTYILVLQGMDDQELLLTDAAQAYFRNAATAELRLIDDFITLRMGDKYRQGVIDALDSLPRNATLIVTGHSLGGIEAQNTVGVATSMRPDVRVSYSIAFGAPVVGNRARGTTTYLDVKALNGKPDWVAHPMLDRGVSTGIIRIAGGSSDSLRDTVNGSHHIYSKSGDLEALGPDGQPAKPGSCLELDRDSLRSFAARDSGSGSRRWPPCSDTSFDGVQPASVTRPLNSAGWQGWKKIQQAAWTNATTLTQMNEVSERIGEKAMDVAATSLGYRRLLTSSNASSAPQGFDAVYLAPDGTYVVAEAKGGYAGKGLEDIAGYGYRCRQGSIEWVRRAAERILTAGTTNSEEQQVAQQIRNRIMTRAPGFGVRVELFHTEHTNGTPGVTKRYVTATSP
jgi:hypothetical protein